MGELLGGFRKVGWVAVKALLLYLTAVFGFRLGKRRTLAEMSAFDFVAAVAVGAIVGRVPNASTTSYIAGATTLATVLIAHGVVAKLRRFPNLATLFDHPPRVLVSRGQVLISELRRAGLTMNDLYGLLRQHGMLDLKDAYLVSSNSVEDCQLSSKLTCTNRSLNFSATYNDQPRRWAGALLCLTSKRSTSYKPLRAV